MRENSGGKRLAGGSEHALGLIAWATSGRPLFVHGSILTVGQGMLSAASDRKNESSAGL